MQYSDLGDVRNGIVDPDYKNVAPRLGFAYSPAFSHGTVIRGAFGVFYATESWNTMQFMVNAPRYYSAQTLTSDPVTPTLSLQNLFPPLSGASTTALPFSRYDHARTPYVLEWNYDVQHMFGRNWMADIGYVGNRGNHLTMRRNLDAAPFDPTGTIPLVQREPWPNFSGILLEDDGGFSTYNALAARLEKRTSAGLYFLGSYTYSHCLNLTSYEGEQSYAGQDTNVYNYGQCTWNVPQRAVFSYVYELPFGRGRRFFANMSGVADKLFSGWEVTGITTFAMGQFMTVTLPGNWMNIGPFTTAVPNKVGPAYPSNRTLNDWLDINSFVYPGCPSATPCTQGLHIEGNSGRNQIEVPGVNNWDMGLMKQIQFSERVSAQFRAEFFNTWNHPQFDSPSGSLVPGTFGRIHGLLIPAREIQFGLKLFF